MLQMLLDYGADLYGVGERQYLRSCELAFRNGHGAARELLEFYYTTSHTHVTHQLPIQEHGFSPSDYSIMTFQVGEATENI
jgi:hypothetical protein